MTGHKVCTGNSLYIPVSRIIDRNLTLFAAECRIAFLFKFPYDILTNQ